MISSDILLEAANIVGGARNETHGDKGGSFASIGLMWTAYLTSRRDPNGAVRPIDVAHMMVLLKQVRADWGTPSREHFTDACGYSALAGELAIGQSTPTEE